MPILPTEIRIITCGHQPHVDITIAPISTTGFGDPALRERATWTELE
jgi:hypothetical protein